MKSIIVGAIILSAILPAWSADTATNAATSPKVVNVTTAPAATAQNTSAADKMVNLNEAAARLAASGGKDTNALPPGAAGPGYKLPSGRWVIPMLNTNKVAMTNLVQKASYVIGIQNASSILMSTADGEMVDPELVLMGMHDVFYHYIPMLRQDEADQIIKKFEKAVQEYEAELTKKQAEDNRLEGIKFLEENKKKEGVKVTESGLQYKVVKEGAGKTPTLNDRVKIHFRSRNVQGFEFNNSYKHGPVTIPISSQIKAWREALCMMKEGGLWELYVPSELAYGTREVGKGVGPNSALIFELELLSVEKSDSK